MRPDDDRYIHAPRMMTDGLFLEKSPKIEPFWHSWLAGAFIVLGFMVPVIILTLSSGK